MTVYAALAATLNGQTQQAARAYAGVGRKKETLADLRERLRLMTIERDDFRARWLATQAALDAKVIAYDELAGGRGLSKRNINGRPVGNGSELARLWNVGADRVTKWKAQGRVMPAGKDTKGRALFYLDDSKPAPLHRGKTV